MCLAKGEVRTELFYEGGGSWMQQELRTQQSPAWAPAAPAWCQTLVLTEQEQQQPGRGICAAGTDSGGREAGLGVTTQKGEKSTRDRGI